MQKRIIITVGGTGGHIFPALALAEELKVLIPDVDLLFVGGRLSQNKYFQTSSYPFQEIPCGTISLKSPIKSCMNLCKISLGIWKSYWLLKEYNPHMIIGFGSYYTLPLLSAAILNRLPIILHEANRYPGRVNKLFSRFAQFTGTHFPDTSQFLRGTIVQADTPLRKGYRLGSVSRKDACHYFHLDPSKKTLLIFGGSQGALAINEIVTSSISHFSPKDIAQWQILHFTGSEKILNSVQKKYEEIGIRACVKAFETKMDMAWQAADLVISRAGASTIAEQIEFEVPAIFIPFPFATDDHQTYNASFVEAHIEAARIIAEKELNPQMLSETVLLLNLSEMKSAIQDYKKNKKYKSLSSIIQETLL